MWLYKVFFLIAILVSSFVNSVCSGIALENKLTTDDVFSYVVNAEMLSNPEKRRLEQIKDFIEIKKTTVLALLNGDVANKPIYQAQAALLGKFCDLVRSVAITLELLSSSRLETVVSTFAMQNPLNYKQRQHAAFYLINKLFEELRSAWDELSADVVLFDVFYLKTFNFLQVICWLKEYLLLPCGQQYSFLTMFHQPNDHILQRSDFPDLCALYGSLTEEFLRLAAYVQHKNFLYDATEQKTLSEKLSRLISGLENARDKVLHGQSLVADALDFLCCKAIGMRHEVLILPDALLENSKNTDKVDILVRDKVLRESVGFNQLVNHSVMHKYVTDYVQIMDYYFEKQVFDQEYMVQLYALVNHLDELLLHHTVNMVSSFLGYKDLLHEPIKGMVTVLRHLADNIAKRKQDENLLQAIMTGDWFKANSGKTASFWQANNLSIESLQRLATGDSKEFKAIALKTLLYSSPLIALGVLRYVAPHLSVELRHKVLALLGVSQETSQPKASEEDAQRVATLLENNPEILSQIVEKNPQLATMVANQLRTNIEA